MTVIAADTLQISHVLETVGGQTPATPTFEVWRTTGESVTFEMNTTESGELGSTGRSQQPANVTGQTVGGDINFELARFQALDDAIAGVLANAWGDCPLTPGSPGGGVDDDNRNAIGQTMRRYTIEKRFPSPDHVPGTFPAADAPSGVPGASPQISFTGAAATGTGIARCELVIDGGPKRQFDVSIAVGNDGDAVAAAMATLLNAEDDIGAVATGNTVDLTTTGTQFDSVETRTGADQYLYQRYVGCTYSVLNLDVTPNEPVTGNVTVVSGEPVLDELPIVGATYNPAGNSPVFTAPQVLELTVGQILGIGTQCWTTLGIQIDSQNRGITCIGFQGEKEVVLGTASVALEGEIYFSSQEILEAVLNNETIGDGVVTLTNADGEVYRFDFPDMRAITASLAAGGTGEDLTIPLVLNPTPKIVCSNAGEDWKTGVVVSKVNSAPPTW